jgi:hypothetical protein
VTLGSMLLQAACASSAMTSSTVQGEDNEISSSIDTEAGTLLKCVHALFAAGTLPGGVVRDNGTDLLSGWVARQGKVHGIMWWRKTWLERRRFALTVFSPPATPNRSEVRVQVYTEERPNESYPWQPNQQEYEAEAEAAQIMRLTIAKCSNR